MFRSKLFKTFVVLLTLLSLKTNAQDADILSTAKGYLNDKHQGLSKLEALDLIITDQTFNKKNGVTYVYFRQTYQGIEIINANSNMAFKDGKIVHQTGKVISKLMKESPNKTPSVSAVEAIQNVASHLSLNITEPLSHETARTDDPNFQQFGTGGISIEPIPVKLVYWQNEEGQLRLAYDLSIYPKDQENWWSIRIDAQTGEILEKGDWVTKCQFDVTPHDHRSSNNLTGENNNDRTNLSFLSGEQYNVYPYPIESPNHGSISLVVAPYNVTSSPFGWHDTNGVTGAEYTITRGNNVYAYEDINGSNIPGFSPDGGANLNFNFTTDFGQNPDTYQSASITNLFYWNNLMHDVFSNYGFDEQSGNFQTTNYSGLGSGNDAVRAEDQDGSGTDNANFATPPEGSAPRMQMYNWETSEGSYEVIISSPAAIAGTYNAKVAAFGLGYANPPSGTLALVSDGSANPSFGCNTLTNGSSISGKIAVIDRGDCSFVSKVKNAQNAGAKAVIVLNNVSTDPITMGYGEEDEAMAQSITIPALMVSQSTGTLIKANLPNVTVSFNDNRSYVTSSYDNGIIAHEYGHGISTRLAGGATNSGCLESIEQMGEGWSDYFSLIMTMKASDQGSNSRGIGTYAADQPISGGGIRPAPYTTNMAINPFTYEDLSNPGISQPHGIGFLWCTMIWDMTWLFVDRYGFDTDLYTGQGGNNIALQLVMDGLKLQPCSPGFVDGRDAILLADRLNNNGANQDIIWEAFARRGLGYSASQGSANNREDGVVAYDLPPSIIITKSVDNNYGQTGDIVQYKIKLQNVFDEPQTNIVVIDALPEGITLVEGSLSEGGTAEGSNLQFSLEQLDGLAEVTFSFLAEITSIDQTDYILLENNENGNGNWTTESIVNTNVWTLQTENPHDGELAWFVENVESISNQALVFKDIQVPENTKLVVWHYFDTEASFDGGIIELSQNGGSTWADIGSKIIENGYTGRIEIGSGNPIQGRNSFTGSSNGYIRTVVDLSNYAGKNIKLRFRFCSDEAVAETGWFIDEIFLFAGEEKAIVNEACLTYTGLSEETCASSFNTTLLADDVLCTAYPGVLGSVSLKSKTFCEETNLSFNTTSKDSDSSIRFFITESAAPYNILLTSSDGNFDHGSLDLGDYHIWILAFSLGNEQDVDTYLESITNIDEIFSEIDELAICASITDVFSDQSNGTISKTACVLSIDKLGDVTYYPNPSNGKLTLSFKNQNAQEIGLKVYNLQGQTVMNQILVATAQDFEKTLDLSHLSEGLYILNLSIEGKEYQGRIVIE